VPALNMEHGKHSRRLYLGINVIRRSARASRQVLTVRASLFLHGQG
jgi:hypothetical protein